MATARNLHEVLTNIKDPRRWASEEVLLQVLREVPSVRGIVYGNVAEVEFANWLVRNGIPVDDQLRDDDHLKTKSDRTILRGSRKYTIQLKSMQTNSIKEIEDGRFQADIQVDASDRRTVTLPNGHMVNTTCYVAGEFDILGVPLHPFLGEWEFAFKLNVDLPRSRYRKYAEEDRQYLLKTLVGISFPIEDESGWSTDLFGLIDRSPDLGEVIDENETRVVVRPPGEKQIALVEEEDGE